MATSMATSTIAHQIPPAFILPRVPRVRPPRMLPGTPSPNTNPQPPGPVPHNSVWVQGKWRHPNSNAAKDRQLVQSRRVEKALEHQRHGMNIYAYSHIRTNQVVYSLTRVMQNNKILEQLVYHGKKSVPAALRRDMWTPYFSVHFPATPAGSQAGLLAYQQLRELSSQRQLSPPDELIITTQDDIDRIKMRYDPIDLGEGLRRKRIKLPILGQSLPQQLRAKRLMDQKATSVADVAFVLGLQFEDQSPNERYRRTQEELAEKGKGRSRKFRKRLRILGEQREEKMKVLEKRAEMVRIVDGNKGQLKLDNYTAKRISIEYQGRVVAPGQVAELKELEEAKKAAEMFEATEKLAEKKSLESTQEIELAEEVEPMKNVEDGSDADSTSVKILWADIRDGTYAQEWPENVVHNELERKAVAAGKAGWLGSSVHVMAAKEGAGLYSAGRERTQKLAEAWLAKLELAKEEQPKRMRMNEATRLEVELVALKLKIDGAVLQTAQNRDQQQVQSLRDTAEMLKSEFEALSQQLDATDRFNDREFQDLRMSTSTLRQRLRSTESVVDEFRREARAIESGEEYGYIMPVERYLELNAEAQQQVGDSTNMDKLDSIKEAWPQFRRYEDEVASIEETNAGRSKEVSRMKDLLKKKNHTPEERSEAWQQVYQLETLIREEKLAPERLWRDLVLGRDRTNTVPVVDVAVERKRDEFAQVKPVGRFARVRQAIMNRLPFGGRRQYSISARQMDVVASTSEDSARTIAPNNAAKLLELGTQLRWAEHAAKQKARGIAVEPQHKGYAAAMEIGAEEVRRQVKEYEAQHPETVLIAEKLDAYYEARADRRNRLKRLRTERHASPQPDEKSRLTQEINKLNAMDRHASRSFKAELEALGLSGIGEKLRG